jgi:hypothetical protein
MLKADNQRVDNLNAVSLSLKTTSVFVDTGHSQQQRIAYTRAINERIRAFSDQVILLSSDVQTHAEEVRGEAEQERIYDEEQTKRWTTIYYALFAFGWVVTLASIFIGEPEEKDLVQELARG